MFFGKTLPDTRWIIDAFQASHEAGFYSGCFTAAFTWKRVFLLKGFAAGYLSLGAAVGGYLAAALLIDRYAHENLREWARPLSLASAVGATLATAALFCVPLDVVLLANIAGIFCYHFFAEESSA